MGDIVKCKKCNSNMFNGCCVRCGYMDNNTYVKHENAESKFNDMRNYNKSFDKMYRNDKSIFPFILSFLYISYRNHLLAGFIIGIIDVAITISLEIFLGYIFNGYLPLIMFSLIFTFLFFKRLLYSMFANDLCLKLDSIRIKKLKSLNKSEKICNHSDKSFIKIFIHIMLYILIFTLFIIFKRLLNGTLR